MILYSDIIESLIGEHKFEVPVSLEIKDELIRLFSKTVDALFVGKGEEETFAFKSFIQQYLPELYEKADSLRFERQSYENTFKELELKKGLMDKKMPNIEDVNLAFSKILHLNPFIYEVEEGFYTTDDGPYIHLEITDIDSILLDLFDDADFPSVRADLVFAEESIDKIHRFQIPTYIIPLIVRDLLIHPDPQSVANVITPMIDRGNVVFQDEGGFFSLPMSQYSMEAKTLGIDKPIHKDISDTLNSDTNMLLHYAHSQGAPNELVMAIYGAGSTNMSHRSFFSSITPNFLNSPMNSVIDSFEKNFVYPIILDQVRDTYLTAKDEVNWESLDMEQIRQLLHSAQVATITGIGSVLKKVAKYYGYEKVGARVGIYNNTELVEGLIKTGIDVLHIRKGGLDG
jgi:hypothetical protein